MRESWGSGRRGWSLSDACRMTAAVAVEGGRSRAPCVRRAGKTGLAGKQRSGSRMWGWARRGTAWQALVVALTTWGAIAAMTSAAAAQGAREPWPTTDPGHRSHLIL